MSKKPGIGPLLKQLSLYYPSVDSGDGAGLVRRAYDMASQAHHGQKRLSGEPYVNHAVATATLLAELRLDPMTLAAALLHDVPEDTETPLDRIRDEFGGEVAGLVDGVTKLSQIEWDTLELVEAASLRKMFLAMAEDVRVVLIKLADRLHNMRTLHALPEERRREVARETLEIFAPLTSRLGIWQIKWELEDLALKHLDPDRYDEIAGLLAEGRAKREEHISEVVEILQDRLRETGVEAEITGRPKHIYSILRKMEATGRDFQRIYDVRALRVIVAELKDCYAVLGEVHSLWRPLPGEFDDYIARPKENLYQSLHTAVLGPKGKALEVQIRTEEMHQLAEYGIAAHWRYKEGVGRDSALEARIAWLRQLTDWRRELSDAQEFVDSLKADLFPDQVYLFTPKGDVIDLPAGATPIDFAYHIHTEIGHLCRGAKVNGKLVSLDTMLSNGDQVEIVTAKRGGPSRDWLNPHLNYVVTSRARQKIRQWFRRQQRAESIAHGRELLEKELKRLGLQKEPWEEIARTFNYKKVDDFLLAIGHGDVQPQRIGTRLLEGEKEEEAPAAGDRLPPSKAAEVRVSGVGDLVTQVARCCNPLPGDPIVGYVTRGRGVTVHRADCRNIVNKAQRERLIEVDWGPAQEVYPVMIQVVAFDRKGLLKDIAAIVEDEDVNMSSASAETSAKDRTAVISATLEITGMAQLSRILSRIESLSNVLEARRETA
ncbi:MAG: RelA/SpoT family protein [Anaerolineae bacterium]